ncbi:MAG: helix-turn-helix domain-containing protein [Rhodococcus sp. (in: high G+C Gram-positive bacteria)]
MRAAPLLIADSDRAQLEKWVRSTTTKAGLVQRARIVLLAADGVAHAEIARRFSISRQTVINWRARYEQFGVDGLLASIHRLTFACAASAFELGIFRFERL